jgi:hypothetical protein
MQFRPSTHGFRFTNSFTGWPLPFDIKSVIGIAVPKPSDNYGLCGGMSAAAWDYYAAGRPIPENTTPPSKSTSLFQFLYQRQLATFGRRYTYIQKFFTWMARPLNQPLSSALDGTRKLTRAGYPSVERELSDKGLAVIGLVRVKATSSLAIWKNHQVLVYNSREFRDHRGTTTPVRTIILDIYDPNHPKNDEVTIECKEVVVGKTLRRRPIYGFKCVQHVPKKPDETVRGFFLMKHGRALPPKSSTPIRDHRRIRDHRSGGTP